MAIHDPVMTTNGATIAFGTHPCCSVDGDDKKAALVEKILQNPRIPSPPTLALQILQKSGQEDCTVAELSELLAHDPGLSAKILKTLNSAIYGRSRPVASVRQAVNMLGNRPLRSLVLGLALPAMQTGLEPDAGLRRYWKKSVVGAVMARELAARFKMPGPDDELAATLLRDIGMILMHQHFGPPYDPVWLGSAEIDLANQCAWEETQFGLSHAEVGSALLTRWKLPIDIVMPIHWHHEPSRLTDTGLFERASLIQFVSRLADLDECCRNGQWMTEVMQIARDGYGLEREALEEFLSAIRPKVEEFSSILGVDTGACPGFDDLLATGCDELVRLSVEVATPAASTETGKATPDIYDLLDSVDGIPADTRILQYEIVELLGRGGMGLVFKAFDPGLARHVAIKILSAEMASNGVARERFAREARFAGSLRHEHVVAIHAVNEIDGIPFLVMDYVHGASLGDLMDDGRKFSIAEIARIGRQTALGLAAAHASHLVHRDIKPANILLDHGTLHVRVADFGVARSLDEDFNLSQPGLLVGTPNFMSPEQVDGKKLDAASDLFSLGSVLYTLCTNEMPFQAETISGLLNAVALKEPVPIRELNPNVPAGMVDIIARLQAKQPGARWPSAAAVAEALKPWCA